MHIIFQTIKSYNGTKTVLTIIFMLSSIANALEPYSLKYFDFKNDNGELIYIIPIPHSHYKGECCKKHLGAGMFSFCCTQTQPIWEATHADLEKVGNIHRFDLNVPPTYFWEGTDMTKSLLFYDYRYPLIQKFIKDFFKSSVPNRNYCGQCYNYTHVCKKYDYLDYWYELCYKLQIQRLERMLKKLEDLINKTKKNDWRGNHYRGYFYRLDELELEVEKVLERWDKLEVNIKNSSEVLYKSREKVTKLFYDAYSACAGSLYERGKISFDLGNTTAFIGDITTYISCCDNLSSETLHQIGQAYSEANQYDQAIKILSECIKKDPQNKESYLDRAVSYFETGQFKKSLQDYIDSGLCPTYIDDDNMNYFHISKGITLGACRGAIDSSIDFFPSLLSTLKGIGKGLWAFSENPIGVSKELIESGSKCIEYLKRNASVEFLKENMPTLMEYIKKWDEIDDQQKGYAMGYAITNFGVDMLACSGSAKAVKCFRDMRRANAMLTMDYAAYSTQNLREVIKSSETFVKSRKTFIRKQCKMQVDSQGKHYPKSHNFEKGRSELTVTPDYLDKLAKNKLGTGIPQRKYEFGQANYRELVDFEVVIGEHVSHKTKLKTATTIGEIHYNAEGKFHVVPIHPSRVCKK